MFPLYIGLESPSLVSRQANAVELVTKVCFSLFNGSEVYSATDAVYEGDIVWCNVWRLLLAYRTDILCNIPAVLSI